MSQPATTPRVDPNSVGQDPIPDAKRPTATGNWFKFGALIWIVPILLGVIFAAAIFLAS